MYIGDLTCCSPAICQSLIYSSLYDDEQGAKLQLPSNSLYYDGSNQKNLLWNNDGELNMTVSYASRKTDLRLWLLMHRARHMMALCEDSVFSEYGITNEQFMVLGTVSSNSGSLRPTDLAFLLERSQNAISMLIDRMVKAGLVRKTRDKRDHRVVRVTLTSKGANAIALAIPAEWNLVRKILSRLSERDKRTVASVLETLKCECLGYLNPELDMAGIIKSSVTRAPRLPRLYGRTLNGLIASGHAPKRKGGRKRSVVRRG